MNWNVNRQYRFAFTPVRPPPTVASLEKLLPDQDLEFTNLSEDEQDPHALDLFFSPLTPSQSQMILTQVTRAPLPDDVFVLDSQPTCTPVNTACRVETTGDNVPISRPMSIFGSTRVVPITPLAMESDDDREPSSDGDKRTLPRRLDAAFAPKQTDSDVFSTTSWPLANTHTTPISRANPIACIPLIKLILVIRCNRSAGRRRQ
jgi:hypothetical protein